MNLLPIVILLAVGFVAALAWAVYATVKLNDDLSSMTADRDSERRWANNYHSLWQGALDALAEMTEARDALHAAYAVLATNNDAQRTAQARIVAEEVARAEARAAGMADKPGVEE